MFKSKNGIDIINDAISIFDKAAVQLQQGITACDTESAALEEQRKEIEAKQEHLATTKAKATSSLKKIQEIIG